MKISVGDGLMVVDQATSIVIWRYEDAPEHYRDVTTLASVDWPRALMAMVPKDYPGNIQHITDDPYFAENNLDVYTLTDGTKLYVGS